MMMTTKMIMVMATKIIFMLQKKYDEKKEGQKKGENRGEHLILVYKIVFVMLQKSFAGA